jgi:putative membrane protein (TIGR04086 family)
VKNKIANKIAKSSNNQILKDGVAVAIGSVIFSLLLLGLCAFIMSAVSIPFQLHQTIATVSVVLALFFSALIIGKRRKQNGLILGFISGFIVFLLLLILTLFLGSREFTIQTVVKLIALLCAGGLGGMVGVQNSQKTRKIKV